MKLTTKTDLAINPTTTATTTNFLMNLKTIYADVCRNKQAESKEKKPLSLSQAYSLIVEKTAFYSKQYPDGYKDSPDIEGMENLGFVENPTSMKDIMTGMGLRENVIKLFANGGWNNQANPKSFLRDFEFSFLQPICQIMAKAKLSNLELASLLKTKESLTNFENKISEEKEFDVVVDIKKDIPSTSDTTQLLDFCYRRSGKTVNDVTIGEGEVLMTLFTNAAKAPEGGDLIFPNIGKVEVKGDEGRLGKPGKHINDNFKNDVKNFLEQNNKPLISQNKREIEQIVQNKQQELSKVFEKDSYKSIFNDNFEIKILDVMLELNASNLQTLKKELFPYKIPKLSKILEKSLDYIIDQYKKADLLSASFDATNIANQQAFRDLYNEIRDLLLGFEIGVSKSASNVFDKPNATFLKNFVVQDFQLDAKQMAEVLSYCVKGLPDVSSAQSDIVEFLSSNDNYTKLKQGDQSILSAIIFALQISAYSYNEFEFLMLVNKQTKKGIAINCSTKSLKHLIEKYIELKDRLVLSINMDNRGGSQITFV